MAKQTDIVDTGRRGHGKIWPLLACYSNLCILYHLPIAFVSRVVVRGAGLVGLFISSYELGRGTLGFAFDRKGKQRIFEPIVADIRFELEQRRKGQNTQTALQIVGRGLCSLSTAIVDHIVVRALEEIAEIAGFR